MAISVLVITPTAGFGELIRETLRDSGRYQAVLVNSGEEAIAHATQTSFNVTILDADLEDVHPASLARSLRKVLPNLRLIIIPPQSGEGRAALESVSPEAYLDKPFYFPDLLDTVDRVMGIPTTPPEIALPPDPALVVSPKAPAEARPKPPVGAPLPVRQPSPKVKAPPPPPWLEDVSRAAQHLTRLSLESAAQAALITRGGNLWAYAGQLPQPAAQELAQAVGQFWENNGGSDLARFIRLTATGDELMLYATGLGAEMVLALAFDAQTPFSKMRSQAGHLARALSSPPVVEPVERGRAANAAALKSPPSESGEAYAETAALESFLSGLLPPTPPVQAEPQPTAPREEKMVFTATETPPPILETFATPPRFGVAATQTPSIDENLPSLESSGETQVAAPPQPDAGYILQPIFPGLYQLAYACLLLPRLPGHHLISDLSLRLNEWLPQLCLAFGWRLERLSIRPDYLQWVVSVGPNVSPAYLVRVIRRQTSQRIFAEFPRLAQENPSGDFWTSGYLVMSGQQLPPAQVLKDFVAQTRRQQGIL